MDQERKWEEAAAAPESVQEPVPVPDAEEPAAEAAPESMQEPASESAGHSPDGSLNREWESFSPPGDAWEESRAVQQESQAGDGEPSDSAAFPQTAAQEDEWGTPPPAPVQGREPFSAAGQGDGAPHTQAWQTPGTYPQGNPYARGRILPATPRRAREHPRLLRIRRRARTAGRIPARAPARLPRSPALTALPARGSLIRGSSRASGLCRRLPPTDSSTLPYRRSRRAENHAPACACFSCCSVCWCWLRLWGSARRLSIARWQA